MKDTLAEDLKTVVEYHFGQIHYRDDGKHPILSRILGRSCSLILAIRDDVPYRAIEIAEDLMKIVRCHVHQEWGVACKRCGGAGTYLYGSGSTWRGGQGVASITEDVCDVCWGTGRADKTGLDLRELVEKAREVKP